MNKKGFTLIELLAVILVLALIVTIVTPILTTTISKSKKSIYENDIKLYAESIKKAVLAYEMEYKKIPESIENLKDILKYDGSEVTCDKIIIETRDNVYMAGCSVNGNKLNDFVYGERPVCLLVEGNEKEIGSKYQCKVQDNMEEPFEDGYYFYILSTEDDGSYNLIMDRNMCDDGTPTEEGKTCLVAYNSSGDATGVGPVTAMNYLNDATSDWSNIPNLNITYNDEGGHFTNFQITGKARLPRYDEVHGEGKCLTYSENGNKYGSCPLWLANYLKETTYYTPEDKVNISGIYGYWTLSSYPDTSISFYAWSGYCHGNVTLTGVDIGDGYGVRPVVNLKL